MKKLYLSSLLAVAIVGCATLGTGSNFQTDAGKFLSSVALTVDTAMKSWGTLIAVGQVSPDSQDTVRVLYGQYQVGMMVATNAYALAVKTGDTATFIGPSNNLVNVKVSLVSATQKTR